MNFKDLENVRIENEYREVKRGEVFMVNLDRLDQNFIGSEQKGSRPAVIVSNDVGNKVSPVVEVVYITSGIKAKLPTHVTIDGINVKGVALCESINTLSKLRLDKRICMLSEQQMQLVNKALCISLEITKKPQDSSQQNEVVKEIIKVVPMEVEGADENHLIKQLNDHMMEAYNLGSELSKKENEISKIMQSDIILSGLDEDYLTEEMKDEIRHKAAEKVQGKKVELENNIASLLGINKAKVETPLPVPETRKPAVMNPAFEGAVKDMVESSKGKEKKYTILQVKAWCMDGKTLKELSELMGENIAFVRNYIAMNKIQKPDARLRKKNDEFFEAGMNKEQFRAKMVGQK